MVTPDYVVGFVDGEGCFCVPISRHKTLRQRREVRPTFEIELREDDLPILKEIRRVLGCGNIYHLTYRRYERWRPHVKLTVTRMDDLQQIIIPFFTQHPLQAKKRKSFSLFKRIVGMVARKEHLTPEGLNAILKLRHQMNP